ncbi:Long chain acyl-CoA synthetase 7 peroxisomal [Entophlyctis sp. JEL0112]|nr:Long chain acyl-CoA synthetase 7 peroxisomal [Entophlyctis sp. JEL0112]
MSTLHKNKKHLTSLVQGFNESVAQFPNRPMLGHRPKSYDANGKPVWEADYVWQSYRRISERRVAFGSGLLGVYRDVCGGAVTDRFNVAVYSVNRPAWAITDLANMSYALTTVPLYDTLGASASEFILNHSKPPVLVCSFDKIESVIGFVHKCPSVKVIISMDDVLPQIAQTFTVLKKWALDKGVKLLSFAEVEGIGAKAKIDFPKLNSDDVCCISYTSGTTGDPKGAMISHRNVYSMIMHASDSGVSFDENDVYISYLPMAHVYEKVMFTGLTACGAAVGFYRGDVALLLDDIATLKPTIFCSVPRLLNRIYDKIQSQANGASALKSFLFNKAVSAKIANYETTGQISHGVWDALVFRKVQAALGGRVRFICSSSAPIHPNVVKFLTVAFGCEVREGYGQTESSGAISFSLLGDRDFGHVGAVISGQELKLVSVPEMGYNAKDNKGEVWVRGSIVFKGYYDDEEKTREAITKDGWLKTGDIARLDDLGRLTIIDRKKNIFKTPQPFLQLSQGEYIAPEKLENVYVKAPSVSQMFVHGESLRSELVAIAVLDPETCIPLGRKLGILPADTPDPGLTVPGTPVNPHVRTLAQSAQFKKIVMAELQLAAADAKLAGFEVVKDVYLEAEAFGVENDLLTPTMKLKRRMAVEKYKDQIADMYKNIETNGKLVAKL